MGGAEMSLINQMLKDLEQRNAGATGVKPLSGEVRGTAAPDRAINPLVWTLMAVLLLGGAVFAWFRWDSATVQQAQMPVPVVSALPAPSVVEQAPPTVAEAQPVPAVPEKSQPEVVAKQADVPTKPVPSATVAMAEEKTAQSPESLPEQPRLKPSSAKPIVPSIAPVAKQVSPQQRSDNLYRQAVGLVQQGRVAEAQTALQQSLESSAANHNARQLLVGIEVDAGRNAEAMALLKDGISIAPEQSGFSMVLARLQVDAADRVGALGTLEHGLAGAGDDAEYHAFLATLLQREGRHEEAASHYLTALRSNPAMPTWLVGVGISWEATGNTRDAIDAFQRAKATGQLSQELAQFVEKRLGQLAL
jgi:MSHA biogenesis protein MshN